MLAFLINLILLFASSTNAATAASSGRLKEALATSAPQRFKEALATSAPQRFKEALATSIPQRFKEAPKFYNSATCPALNTHEHSSTVCSDVAVHVAMTLDAAYLRGSMAAILSVLQHSSCPENIIFHFVSSSSSSNSQALTQTIATSFPYLKFRVYPFNDSAVLGLISTSIRSALDCPLNYARNYLANLLPTCVRRVVYLDSDLILVDDISKLASTPLEPTQVLAAPEYCNANFTSYFTPSFWANPTLSLTFENRRACYFNTGVMVIDLDKWRAGGYTDRIVEWMELQKRMRIYELGSLPPFLLVFAGNIAAVDHQWNQHGLGGDNFRFSSKLSSSCLVGLCITMERGVQRWVVDISGWDPSPQDFSFALSVLPSVEQPSITRFVQMEDRKRALVSRLLQYALVNEVLAIPYDEIIIKRTLEGKPYLECGDVCTDFPNFNFNASHHGDYVAIASEPLCLVGVDIVSIVIPQKETVIEFIQNFSSYFSSFEWDSIVNAGTSNDILIEFYRYWCLKEAYVKAIGSGVAYGLDRVEFHHSCWTNISVNVEGKAMKEWRFWLLELGKGHLVSIARGHPRSATESYMRTLKQAEFDEEEYHAALHLPNVRFVSRTVEQLIPVSHKGRVHRTSI